MNAETTTRRLRSSQVDRTLRFIDQYLIWILVLMSVAIMGTISTRFFSGKNLLNLSLSSSVLGIMVIAASLPFLIGKIDLSIESTFAFAALIGGMMVKGGANPYLAMAAVPLVGLTIGLVNGLFIVYLGVNHFVQTLAMNIIFRGMIFMLSGGLPFHDFPASYRLIGASSLLGVPTPILILVAFYLLFILLLQRTRWGRRLYAMGQNTSAAYFSGVNINRSTVIVFALSGVISAFAGLIISTRLNSIDYNVGVGYAFDIFAAAVIGGISLSGGRGSLIGAIGGVLFLTVVSSILTWLNLSIYWVDTTRGFIILFAVWLDAFKNRLRLSAQPG
jgi:ribose/xylose/arabinose/galactoside ABC-type transport system permease subunit